MKAILLIISALLIGSVAISNEGVTAYTAEVRAPASSIEINEDDCECLTSLNESDGQWTVSVKNPCKANMVAECWYLVEYSDGTKDTETVTIRVPADSSMYVASDFLATSHCLEHGCACRPE